MAEIYCRLKRYESYCLPALGLIVLAVFSPVLGYDFVNFDDPVFVYQNPYVQSGLTWAGSRWAFTTVHEANWIPLTWISHMLDVQLFGMNPAGHHAINVLLHAASSCLLYVFLRQATGTVFQSLLVALLFGLHPLRVESVAWVAERKDVLSVFFWMMTLNAYLWYSQKPVASRYIVTIACFSIGLLTKPMLVTLPFVLIILDWWPFCKYSPVRGCLDKRIANPIRLIVEKIPYLLLAACSSVITYQAQQISGDVPQGYTFLSRLGKACIAYTDYLRKMIWPFDLAVLYPFSKYPPSTTRILLSIGFLLIVTGITFWLRKRHPFLLMGWMWYLVTLLPVIGLIQIGQHSIADRYTYIPLTGVFIMIVFGISRLLGNWPYRTLALGIVSLCMMIGMVTLTLLQLRHWKNSLTLFTHTLQVTSDNWVAHNNLGLVLYDEGQVDDAIEHYRRALNIKPSYTPAYMNLGVAYRAKRDFQMAEDAFSWVLKIEAGNELAHYNLGLLYLDFKNTDLALQQYQLLQSRGSFYAVELLNAMSAIGAEYPSLR